MKISFFGNNGTATYTGGTAELSRDIGFDSYEYIFTAGYFQPTGASVYGMGVWKYMPGGDIITTFGDSGVARFIGSSNNTEALDSQGRILVVGSSSNGTDTDMIILRLHP